MIIGVLTLPLHTNIGGILQAYALYTTLERLGHKVYMLEKKKSIREKIKQIIKKILINGNKKNQETIDSQNFIRKYFHNWYYFKRKDKMNSFDALVVGSDQVWRSWGKKWDVFQYYFDFTTDSSVKKYAYAASFGKNDWMYSDIDTALIKSMAQKFKKISVREEGAVSLCKEYLDVEAEWLLDPTMLLVGKDYENLLPCKAKANSGLVCYFIGENEDNKVFFKSALDTTASFFDNKWTIANKKVHMPEKNKGLTFIENWLYNMMNASFVITNSFHGVAFSIIFQKPFIVLSLEGGGMSRINSILSMFGLKSRLAYKVEDITNIINEKIDWNKILEIKETQRKQSIDFLKSIE